MNHDLLIIGGGINGAALAREAALNGLSVLLVERDDLASHTSSASTKLIHGGLRYLEYYEFKLVREALQERERLVKAAPHLIYPKAFILPHTTGQRPWWMVRAGLYLYDWIGGKISLPRSRGLRTDDALYQAPLKVKGAGFVYSDAWVDDARLVVLNALDAAAQGADIRTRTALVSARREDGIWNATLSDGSTVSARAIINAAGPWVTEALAATGSNSRAAIRLIKGSHIVVDRLFEGEHAYMLQQPDGRIVFAIPWLDHFTLIGTTDEPVERPEDATISAEEIAYLCAAANLYFTTSITPGDVRSTYSGVRPLYDDGASEAKSVTRDYVLELDTSAAPILSVFGGKITTARHLAEDALGRLLPAMGLKSRAVTRDRVFPGGALGSDFDSFLRDHVLTCWPYLGTARAERMARAYGTMLDQMLAHVQSEADLGADFGGGLTAVEADWLVSREWATTADDILLRRTKIGLVTGTETRTKLENWLKERGATTT